MSLWEYTFNSIGAAESPKEMETQSLLCIALALAKIADTLSKEENNESD